MYFVNFGDVMHRHNALGRSLAEDAQLFSPFLSEGTFASATDHVVSEPSEIPSKRPEVEIAGS